jgi:hypothetical protein
MQRKKIDRYTSQGQTFWGTIKRRLNVFGSVPHLSRLDSRKPEASTGQGLLSLILVTAIAISLVILSIGTSWKIAHSTPVLNFTLSPKK